MSVVALLSVVAGVCFYGAQVALCLRRPPPELWPAEPLAETPRGWSTLSSTVVSRLVIPRVDLDSWATAQPSRAAVEEAVAALDPQVLSVFESANPNDASCPRYSDATDPHRTEEPLECASIVRLQLHKLQAVVVINDALHDRCDAAFGRTALMLRRDAQTLAQQRSVMSNIVAMAQTLEAVQLAGTVLEACPNAKHEELATAILAVPERLTLRRAIVDEYTAFVAAVEVERTRSLPGLVDPRDTLERANTWFPAVMACVEKPGTPCPEKLTGRQDVAWWLHNPGGKLLIDAAIVALGPCISQWNTNLELVRAKRSVLLAKLAAR